MRNKHKLLEDDAEVIPRHLIEEMYEKLIILNKQIKDIQQFMKKLDERDRK